MADINAHYTFSVTRLASFSKGRRHATLDLVSSKWILRRYEQIDGVLETAVDAEPVIVYIRYAQAIEDALEWLGLPPVTVEQTG